MTLVGFFIGKQNESHGLIRIKGIINFLLDTRKWLCFRPTMKPNPMPSTPGDRAQVESGQALADMLWDLGVALSARNFRPAPKLPTDPYASSTIVTRVDCAKKP